MGYTLLTHTKAPSSNTNDVTTPAIDTTGASLLIAAVGDFEQVTASVVTDSKGNIWTTNPPTPQPDTTALQQRAQIYYCLPTSVGTGHTATATKGGASASFPGLVFAAFSGSKPATPFDQENGLAHAAGGGPYSPGSVTPSEDNELVLAVIAAAQVETYTIDNGFTIIENQALVLSNAFGIALAYKIQTTAAAVNPAWSPNTSGSFSLQIATFKAGVVVLVAPSPRSMALSAENPTIRLGSDVITPATRAMRLLGVAPTVNVGPVVAPAARTMKLATVAPTFGFGAITLTPAAASFSLASLGPDSRGAVFPLNFGSARNNVTTFQSVTWPVNYDLDVLNTIQDYGDGFERRANFNIAFTRADGEAGVTRYKGRNTFHLKLICMDFDAAARVLWRFYKDRTGSLDAFYFYNVPDERTGADPTGQDPAGRYLVRFADGNLSREKFALKLYQADLALIEVRA